MSCGTAMAVAMAPRRAYLLAMRATLLPDNMLPLPEAALDALGKPAAFEVSVEHGRLVLTPARPPLTEAQLAAAEEGYRRFAELELTEQDIEDAVNWARGR